MRLLGEAEALRFDTSRNTSPWDTALELPEGQEPDAGIAHRPTAQVSNSPDKSGSPLRSDEFPRRVGVFASLRQVPNSKFLRWLKWKAECSSIFEEHSAIPIPN
ncbi:hypothetical protein DRI50_02600 [candidate division KSB1 bacterium]|nr:MAG: hypothetical protein DRI50_02600 [candidate division KSB1 bacterium]